MENNGSSLAKISLGINVLLIIAVIILFVKMPGSAGEDVAVDDNDTTSNSLPSIPDDGELKIGFFYGDSLQNNLLMMEEIEGLLAQSQKNAEDQMRAKEREIQKWQESWQSGGQLLPSEQQKYAQEAAMKEQEIAMFQQNLQMSLAAEQEQIMFTLLSKISSASEKYAQENGIDFVFSYQMGQNIYYGSPNMDITNELIQVMNDDYSSRTEVAEEEESAEG